MTDLLQVTIDVTEAESGLGPEDLEARSLILADELRAGKLANSAQLARREDLPAGAKAGALAFIGGLLTAEISRENLKKTLDFLGNQFYGKALTLEYKADGLECSLQYRNPQDVEQALAVVKALEDIRIRVSETPEV
jgi:hypothetical protein